MTQDQRNGDGRRGEEGFSLIEVVFSFAIMATGLLSLAAVLTQGMSQLNGGNSRLIAREKAAEAIESVFTSRDTRTIAWGDVRNYASGGIFLDGAQPLRVPGDDGLVNTGDDGAVEETVMPGVDGVIGTGDDEVVSLSAFTREIEIVDINTNLREIRVTVVYPMGTRLQTYLLTTYVSSFA
jgi:type II secretory pathway pseudopilin PulG